MAKTFLIPAYSIEDASWCIIEMDDDKRKPEVIRICSSEESVIEEIKMLGIRRSRGWSD